MVEGSSGMHGSFAGWYAGLGVNVDPSTRTNRWNGVVNVVTGIERPVIEALVRLAFGTRKLPLPAHLKYIRECFKAADDAFEMSGNDRELQVLAAASLAILMEKDDEMHAAWAALAVTTASLGGGRQAELPMELVSLAEASIRRLGSNVRIRALLVSPSAQLVKLDFNTAIDKVAQQADFTGVQAAFKAAATSAQTALNSFTRQQNKALVAATDLIRKQGEELSMLWWLIGGYSEEAQCPFADVPPDRQPIVFALELAKMTEFLPGPPSIGPLLTRAGLQADRAVAVKTAIALANQGWLDNMSSEISSVTTPLHFGIQRQVEAGGGDTWVANWAAVTEVDAEHSLPALKLAELVYRERLLLLDR